MFSISDSEDIFSQFLDSGKKFLQLVTIFFKIQEHHNNFEVNFRVQLLVKFNELSYDVCFNQSSFFIILSTIAKICNLFQIFHTDKTSDFTKEID
jgi:hypothetical protein